MNNLGVSPDPYDSRDFIKDIPLSVDKKSVDLTSGLDVEILNQQNVGACTGFSTSYLMSILQSKVLGEWVKFDPWFIYWNTRKIDGTLPKNVGSYLRSTFKGLNCYGSLTNSSTNLSYYDQEPSEKEYSLAKLVRIRSYFRIPNSMAKEGIIYSLVSEKLPVIISIKLYKKSWGIAKSTGVLKFYDDYEEFDGNHALCIYGYDKDSDSFLALNSHGVFFGKSGRLSITSSYLSLYVNDIWTVGYNYF